MPASPLAMGMPNALIQSLVVNVKTPQYIDLTNNIQKTNNKKHEQK